MPIMGTDIKGILKPPYGSEFKFFIPKRLPGLNEIISANKRIVPWLSKGRKRIYQYTILKKETEDYIAKHIIFQSGGNAGKSLVFKQAKIDFVWIEPNRRRDPSNVCAGGRKFLLDAMVKTGLLTNDNWLIKDFSDSFKVDKVGAGVQVTIINK